MPDFPKPGFAYEYDPKAELARLRSHKKARAIPRREPGKLLVATWNIANLGSQQRRDGDLSLIAEIVGWFDLIAVQECRENFGNLFDILRKLPKSYRVIMSDASGNDERMAFIYDGRKLSVLEEVGEVAFPPARFASIQLPGINAKFNGFDRTPYLAAFAMGGTSLMFVNVHLYFGDETAKSIARRSLETYAVAKWAEHRKSSPYSFTRELVVLGDFNMPKCAPGDPIYQALTSLGLELPQHATQIASAISSSANYDQIAFFPDTTRTRYTGQKGVFDFDAVVFPDLWRNGANVRNFKAYLRYYLSDHRPMWVQLSV